MGVSGLALTCAGAGATIGPALRALIIRYSVPAGEPWLVGCAHCHSAGYRSRLGWPVLGISPLAAVTPLGRCRGCRGRIGPAPLGVEVVTATVFAVLALRVTGVLPLLACCWVAAVGVVLWHVDLAVQRLPDPLTIPAFLGAVALLAGGALAGAEPGTLGRVLAGAEPGTLGRVLASAAGLAGGYLLLFLIHPAGIGLGDAKLGLSLGAVLGWYGWTAVLLGGVLAVSLGGLAAGLLLVLGRANRQSTLPHGPAMLAGALSLVLLLG